MDAPCESISTLYNAPQRLHILSTLDDAQMDVRDLMTALDSPRSTIQRNLGRLEGERWIRSTDSGYTTTKVGSLLCESAEKMNTEIKTILHLAPFLRNINNISNIDVNLLSDSVVTTPDPDQPDRPRRRLFEAFDGVDIVQGFAPVISYTTAELFVYKSTTIDQHEYVLAEDAFHTLSDQYTHEQTNDFWSNYHDCLTVRVYDGSIPFGLFVSPKKVVLTAYNGNSRIGALVESNSEEAIEWGNQMYTSYKSQSSTILEKTATSRPDSR